MVRRRARRGAVRVHRRPKVSSTLRASAGPFLQGVSHPFQGDRGWKVAQPNEGMLRGKWWEIFKNPELNALEEQLNIDNQNIKQAYQNFMVARALIREARAQYFPPSPPVPPTTGPPHRRTFPARVRREELRGRPRSQAGKAPSILCPWTSPGRRIFSARSAIRCASFSTGHNSAPPTWRTNGSSNRPASRRSFSRSAGRTNCNGF